MNVVVESSRPKGSIKRRVLRWIAFFTACGIAAGGIFGLALYVAMSQDLPDFDSLEDRAVTVRNRDTMAQDRVAINHLHTYLADRLLA